MLIAEYDYATDIRIQREEAREEGREEGREEERELAIKAFIETFVDLQLSKEEATAQIMKRFSLEPDKVEAYLNKYWK